MARSQDRREDDRSATQIHLQETAELIRLGLARRARLVQMMSLAQVRELVSTLDQVQAFETIACTWDHYVEYRRRDLQRVPLPYEE